MKTIGISTPLSPVLRNANLTFHVDIKGTYSRHPLLHKKRREKLHSWQIRSSEVEPTNATPVEETEVIEETQTPEETELDPSFIPVCSKAELPKGIRKEALIDGKQLVVFWYRNEIFACEARSPAEGAYSTGFLDANFTTDYGIICPGTSTVFSLKTGEILEWYPNNFVLRSIIPQDTCRPLEVYPVKTANDTIYVSFAKGSQGGMRSMRSKGGSNTSLEDNNVFGLEPTVYSDAPEAPISSSQGATTSSLRDLNPATILIATIAIGIVSVAGTAAAIYYESIAGLIIFWIVVFGTVAFTLSKVLGIFDK